MTVVCFTSVKGAPGATTTACLVGAMWPQERRVLVAECDPAGGDLAARFALSSMCGWSTYASAVRRAGAPVPVEPHLQRLPGGLEVLVGTRGAVDREADHPVSALMASVDSSSSSVDVLADLGRLPTASIGEVGWPDRSDAVVVVLRSDAASVMRVAERAPEMLARWGDRVGLAVIDGGRHGVPEIERFTGIPVVGELPFDRGAAAVAAGETAGGRRLVRSMLSPAAGRLAEHLSLAGSPVQPRALEGSPAGSSSRRDRWLHRRLPEHRPGPPPPETVEVGHGAAEDPG